MVVALVPALSAPAKEKEAAKGKAKGKVKLQILALNDFHGNLEPPSGSSGRVTEPDGTTTTDAGGAQYLATHLDTLREGKEHSIFVAAGDLIGASPLLSALFHDEPTIEALNLMHLKISSVGNHEFDEGDKELLRMQRGKCHDDGCADGDGFKGADFQYLSANVIKKGKNKTLLPAYKIKKYEGIKVAFIGLTLEGTPDIVTPTGIANLNFRDEANTTNKLVKKLKKKKGVKAFVVLMHEGGSDTTATYNDCEGVSGPVVDIVERTTPQVDIFITGHTHEAYNCVIDGRPVTSSASFGRIVTEYNVELDKATKDFSSISIGDVNNVVVTRTVEPHASIMALIEEYAVLSEDLRNEVIGTIEADIVRAANAAGESPLGDLIADAQLEATDIPELGNPVVAFMNPGGIRADLTYTAAKEEEDGEVTYEEAFTVQPFSNVLTVLTLSGAQIEALLEQQWDQDVPKVLQVSEGFTYSWNPDAPAGDRVDPASIMLNGVMIDAATEYRVTVNNFLASGGDGFSVLTEGTNSQGADIDLDAFVNYIEANSPVAVPVPDRITLVP